MGGMKQSVHPQVVGSLTEKWQFLQSRWFVSEMLSFEGLQFRSTPLLLLWFI
jgi:hypothetical protein